jgi:hypothetical protein
MCEQCEANLAEKNKAEAMLAAIVLNYDPDRLIGEYQAIAQSILDRPKELEQKLALERENVRILKDCLLRKDATQAKQSFHEYPNIWSLGSLLKSAQEVSAEINGRWVPARPMGFSSIATRIRAAYLAFTGKGDVVIWPEGQ